MKQLFSSAYECNFCKYCKILFVCVFVYQGFMRSGTITIFDSMVCGSVGISVNTLKTLIVNIGLLFLSLLAICLDNVRLPLPKFPSNANVLCFER